MNSPSLGSLKMIEALAPAQRTGAENGDPFNTYYVINDPNLNAYIGWFKNAAIFVDQSAGSGNNGGNYLQVTIQGRHEANDPWATIPQVSEIKITENAATGYYSRVLGPLLPQLRIVVSLTGTADATFRVHVALEG